MTDAEGNTKSFKGEMEEVFGPLSDGQAEALEMASRTITIRGCAATVVDYAVRGERMSENLSLFVEAARAMDPVTFDRIKAELEAVR